MWPVFAPVLTLVFAPVQETVRMAQVHVLTGPERRRRFSVAEKRAIVALAFASGAVVSDVARQADVCPSLIYRWRRELGTAGGFAEVVVAPISDDRSGHRVDHGCGELRCLPASAAVDESHSGTAGTAGTSATPSIEVEVSGGSRVRIPASIPPDLAAAVIAALRRR
jgi:transposase